MGRRLRSLLMAVLVPGLLFCSVAMARRGLCLEAYAWEPGVGYIPSQEQCEPEDRASVGEAAGFYLRAVGGLATGRPGRSREDAGRTLASLLWLRGRRSLAILGVAAGGLALVVTAGHLLRRLLDRLRTNRFVRAIERRTRGLGPLAPPGGLPLPLAGLLVFVLVLRLVPSGSILDYDRAGILWAGLALIFADGAAVVLVRGLDHALGSEKRRAYAEALSMWGTSPAPAVRYVSRRVRAAQIRGAVLALIGGLLVVEGVFTVNGLGETLRDIVVDRRGLDPLLLTGVLLLFSLFVLLVEWLPLEAMLGRRP